MNGFRLAMPEMRNEIPSLAFTPPGWKITVSHSDAADIATLTTENTNGFATQYVICFTFPRQGSYIDVSWEVDSKTAEKQPEGGWLCLPLNLSQDN